MDKSSASIFKDLATVKIRPIREGSANPEIISPDIFANPYVLDSAIHAPTG